MQKQIAAAAAGSRRTFVETFRDCGAVGSHASSTLLLLLEKPSTMLNRGRKEDYDISMG